MMNKKNGLKVNLTCFRTSNESFLGFRTSKTLTLEEFDECETHLVEVHFSCIIEVLMFILMQNYGVFTNIIVW